MTITLYKKQRRGKYCFAVFPECLANEISIGEEVFELPEGYDVQESEFGRKGILITRNGKPKAIYTDAIRQLPYIVEYHFNRWIGAEPAREKIYLKRIMPKGNK